MHKLSNVDSISIHSGGNLKFYITITSTKLRDIKYRTASHIHTHLHIKEADIIFLIMNSIKLTTKIFGFI